MRRILTLLIALPVLAQTATVATLQARFTPKNEAAQILTADDYFSQLQVAELRAKTGLPLVGETAAQARIETKAFYAAAAQDFTPEEKAMLQGVLDRVAPKVAEKLPLMARTPFAFIKAGVEGGLPHTRGACIVLSPRLLQVMVGAEAHGALAQLDGFAANLLVHEQTHVLERQHPEIFEPLFTDVFGFKRISAVPDAPSLQVRRVVNPDGPDLGWAFPIPAGDGIRWIRPDLQLKELDHPRMPKDFDLVAVDLVKKGNGFALDLDATSAPKVEPLESIPAYKAAFPDLDEYFHPNEIAAQLLSGWVTGQDKDADQPLRLRTAAWAQKALR